MDEGSRNAKLVLGGTLATLGGGLLVALFTISEDRQVPALLWAFAWIGLVLGLVIVSWQAFPRLRKPLVSRMRSYREARAREKQRDARYRQRLQCGACVHVFEETVVNTTMGWLEFEGAERTCPACGSNQGFQSLGAEPLNKAAKKLGPL